MDGVIIKSTGSWYSVRLQDGKEVKARLPGRFKLENKRISNPIAVGDKVELLPEAENFVIEVITPRKNYIVRKSPKKKHFAHMIAANIDQAVLIASHKRPRTSLGFIDRFLVTLEAFRIPGYLLINKSDLYSKEEQAALRGIMELYESIGYQTMMTSFIEGVPHQVGDWLQAKTTLLSGHSGAGKSTLINLLQPNVHQQIGEISDFANKGVHTTTFAEMFSLDADTHVIDTPGIKELGLAEITAEELSHYFPEMRNLMGQCKFNNCRHVDEPSCAVQEAVQSGDIALSRFESYLSMMQEDDNRR
ncbi:ribosome small subunit-dependent GTPase A [Cyclobacteriaceae bacterium]|nr:ribosome small subunit-dependent GTPase A [Cyclobacteriaceae bacterium]MDB4605995.1 ribosome small subunit-dependent GTPase A [Cyclobacteriaceae bacterium]MDB4741932.1 ribosome small subunit-dependent GTPase A [Cyclobacteriaceae bacterium]